MDVDSDEEDPELYEQLNRQRTTVTKRTEELDQDPDAPSGIRAKERKLEEVADSVKVLRVKDDEKEADEQPKPGETKEMSALDMTATTEFCNVVETPLEKLETMRHESYAGSTLYKSQVAERAKTSKGVKAGSTGKEKKGKTDTGQIGEGFDADEEEPRNEQMEAQVLHEPALDLTAVSGIRYLRERNQLGRDQDTHASKKSDLLPLEMSVEDGDIKLEYRDDYGRVQNAKEAFRSISWKFHGKNPGKKNLERRLSRLETEVKLKSRKPEESLPTMKALKHVQHSDAKPYMVLSGANEK